MMLVLANTPREDIAEIVGSDPATVTAVEQLFFDVRPALSATVWIHTAVIAAVERRGDTELGAKLKVAYYGGPVVAKALVTADCRVPKEEAERLLAQEMLLYARFKAVLDYPLNEQQALEFFKLSLEYQHKRQVLELRKRQFAHRCEQDARRYEIEKERVARKAAGQRETQPASAAGSQRPRSAARAGVA